MWQPLECVQLCLDYLHIVFNLPDVGGWELVQETISACPENALTHQWGHMSPVHLPCGDKLLRRGHGPHIEGVRAADGAGPNYSWERHGAVLHATHPVELLLQDSGS